SERAHHRPRRVQPPGRSLKCDQDQRQQTGESQSAGDGAESAQQQHVLRREVAHRAAVRRVLSATMTTPQAAATRCWTSASAWSTARAPARTHARPTTAALRTLAAGRPAAKAAQSANPADDEPLSRCSAAERAGALPETPASRPGTRTAKVEAMSPKPKIVAAILDPKRRSAAHSAGTSTIRFPTANPARSGTNVEVSSLHNCRWTRSCHP